MHNRALSITLILVLLSMLSCGKKDETTEQLPQSSKLLSKEKEFDLDAIKKRGTLVALTQYSAHSFFIYRGQPMGYEYELLKLFATELGVDLEIKIPSTWDSLYIMLHNGEGDLIAANLTMTKKRDAYLSFSEPHNTTRQMLVQRLPENYRKLKLHERERELIREPLALDGKTISIRSYSSYMSRLHNLIDESGVDITIDTVSQENSTEELIEKVSDGEIDYTMADENIAILNSSYYDNLDVQTPLSLQQKIGWGFRKSSPQLLEAANNWMRKLKANNNPHYYVIYNRYYSGRKNTKSYKKEEMKSLKNGGISQYDSLFKAVATEEFPWYLLASLAYQESQFDPKAHSNMDAKGLMQLLPSTAKLIGFPDITTTENNVKAGAKYLNYVYDTFWKDLPYDEARKFTIASYNAGPGHIQDAQKLAKELKYDPNVWTNNVEKALLKLQNENYYRKPFIKHGYVRGIEPYNYVREINEREELYLKLLKASTEKQKNKIKTAKSSRKTN